MTRDAEGTLPLDFAKNRIGLLIGTDVLFDVERDDVRVHAAAEPVLRDLGARYDEHAVLIERTRRFPANVGEIRVERFLPHAEHAAPEASQTPRSHC